MARELREIANASQFGFLAYLLAMVEQEAETLQSSEASSASGRKVAACGG